MKSHFKVVGWACRAAGGRVGEDKQTQLKTLPPPPSSRLSQFKRYIERMRPTGAGNIHFPLLSICTYCRMSREFVKKRQNFKTMAMAVFAIIAIEADILCVRDRAFLSYHVILQICFCFWCEVALISGRRAAGQAGGDPQYLIDLWRIIETGAFAFASYLVILNCREQVSRPASDVWQCSKAASMASFRSS